jgi:hypothetical protein
MIARIKWQSWLGNFEEVAVESRIRAPKVLVVGYLTVNGWPELVWSARWAPHSPRLLGTYLPSAQGPLEQKLQMAGLLVTCLHAGRVTTK